MTRIYLLDAISAFLITVIDKRQNTSEVPLRNMPALILQCVEELLHFYVILAMQRYITSQ